jgi:hypothetical protein
MLCIFALLVKRDRQGLDSDEGSNSCSAEPLAGGCSSVWGIIEKQLIEPQFATFSAQRPIAFAKSENN